MRGNVIRWIFGQSFLQVVGGGSLWPAGSEAWRAFSPVIHSTRLESGSSNTRARAPPSVFYGAWWRPRDPSPSTGAWALLLPQLLFRFLSFSPLSSLYHKFLFMIFHANIDVGYYELNMEYNINFNFAPTKLYLKILIINIIRLLKF